MQGGRNFRPRRGREIVLVPWQVETSFGNVMFPTIKNGGIIDGGGDAGKAAFFVTPADFLKHGFRVTEYTEVIAIRKVFGIRQYGQVFRKGVNPFYKPLAAFHPELTFKVKSAVGVFPGYFL